MFYDSRENRLRQVVRLEQMAEVEDRRLVGDRVAAELQPTERAHRLDVVKRFLGARVGQAVPLLQAVDAHHDGKRKRPTSALRAHPRIMRFDHRFERRPRHNGCHLGQEHVALLRFFFAAKSSDAKLSWSMAHPRESMTPVCHVRCVTQRFPKQLGYELPVTEAERKAFWVAFSQQVIYRRDPDGNLAYRVEDWTKPPGKP